MINIHRYKDLLDTSNEEKKQSGLQFMTSPNDSADEAEEEKKKAKIVKKQSTLNRDPAEVEAEAFVKFRSCGIDEIKMKIMGEPEQYKD